MRYLILILLLTTTAAPAYAEDLAKAQFETLAHAVVNEDAAMARTCFTQRSLALVDRFVGYGLMNCLPKDAAYVSETPMGTEAVLVGGSITDLSDKKRTMKLVFLKEGGTWKFDLPATLERSMGKKWENQVHLSEQVYLLLKAQMGDRFQCSTLKDLIKTDKAS